MENTSAANVTGGWNSGRGLTSGKQVHLVALVVFLQIFICGENLLVIVLVGCNSKLRQLQNSFLVNLAVADFLYGSVAMTLAFYNFRYVFVWASGPVMCVIAVSSQHGTLMVSSLSVFCSTVDRLLALICPFRYAIYVTKVRVAVAICMIWCLSLIIMACPLFFPPLEESEADKGNVCGRRLYIVTSLILTQTVLLLCATISLSLHLVICNMARRHLRAIQQTQVRQDGASRPTVVAISKASKMLLTITFFAVCIWTPTIIIEYYHYVWPNLYKRIFLNSKTAITLFQLLPAIASISNPLIYSFRNRDFQQALRKLLRMETNFVHAHTQVNSSRMNDNSNHNSEM